MHLVLWGLVMTKLQNLANMHRSWSGWDMPGYAIFINAMDRKFWPYVLFGRPGTQNQTKTTARKVSSAHSRWRGGCSSKAAYGWRDQVTNGSLGSQPGYQTAEWNIMENGKYIASSWLNPGSCKGRPVIVHTRLTQLRSIWQLPTGHA